MCTGFIRGQVSLSGSEGRSLGDDGLQSVRELVLNGWALTGKAGVLAAIATTFANHGVSIQTVNQAGRNSDAEVTIVTHLATEGELKATVESLKKMDAVQNISSVIRVEGAMSA